MKSYRKQTRRNKSRRNKSRKFKGGAIKSFEENKQFCKTNWKNIHHHVTIRPRMEFISPNQLPLKYEFKYKIFGDITSTEFLNPEGVKFKKIYNGYTNYKYYYNGKEVTLPFTFSTMPERKILVKDPKMDLYLQAGCRIIWNCKFDKWYPWKGTPSFEPSETTMFLKPTPLTLEEIYDSSMQDLLASINKLPPVTPETINKIYSGEIK